VKANEKFRQLEGLIHDAARRLRRLKDENEKLRSELAEAKEQTQALQLQAREQASLAARHEKAKARVAKLIESLEKIEAQAAKQEAEAESAETADSRIIPDDNPQAEANGSPS
jgi:chromosome segregation ATPase